MALLGGADVLVFTGGIGENSTRIRANVCRDMEWAGVELCATKNSGMKGEACLSKDNSRVQVWTVPTNEEIVVARQTRDALSN